MRSPVAAGPHCSCCALGVNAKVIIIVLSIALLGAVVVLLFGVRKFIYGIAHYYLRERQPIHRIQHPQLGLLTADESDDTLWTGQARIEGRNIPFVLAGSATAPDERLAGQLQSVTARFGSLERQALEFVRGRESEARDAALDFYMLDVSDERHPEDFTFEFVDGSDDSRVWRFEFADREPRETGFDD
jgi:hypothetical protein